MREVVATYPAAPALPSPIAEVRSTLMVAGLNGLRRRGHIDRYFEVLDRAHRPTIESTIAGTWMPVDVVCAHYRAIDLLALSEEETDALVTAIGSSMRETTLHAIKSVAAGVGVSPWAVLGVFERAWCRMFRGGGYVVTRTGPKDALIRVVCPPLAEHRYFRTAFCGVLQVAMGLFSSKVYVRLLKETIKTSEFSVRAAWV